MPNFFIISILLFQLSITALGVAFIITKRSKKTKELEAKNKELQDILDKHKSADSNFYG